MPEDVQAEPVCSPGAMPLLAGRGGGGDIAGLLPLQLGDCPQGDLQLREDPAGTLPRRQPDRGAAQSETPKHEGSGNLKCIHFLWNPI